MEATRAGRAESVAPEAMRSTHCVEGWSSSSLTGPIWPCLPASRRCRMRALRNGSAWESMALAADDAPPVAGHGFEHEIQAAAHALGTLMVASATASKRVSSSAQNTMGEPLWALKMVALLDCVHDHHFGQVRLP